MPHHEEYVVGSAYVTLTPRGGTDNRCALCARATECAARLFVRPASGGTAHGHDVCRACANVAHRLLARLER